MVSPSLAATERAAMLHDRQGRRRILVLAGLGCAVLAALLLDIATGPSSLGLVDAAHVILDPSAHSRAIGVIIWEVRLPQALMACLIGMALALAGAEMQTILNNPLASPFTLGVSSAASFGAASAIILDIGIPGVPAHWIVSANAFAFAFGSVLLLQMVSRLRGTGVETLVLFGIALVFTFNALVAIIQFVASETALQQFVFWSMGSLARASWDKLQILVLALALVGPFSFLSSWKLTALRLGEDRAHTFGIDVPRLRLASLFRVSILAGVSVAFVGMIGFIGLVGPHIARFLVGEDHRFYLPASALTGACVMSLASVASKMIVPGVLIPIGIVTALIGVPVFMALVLGNRERT